MALEDQKWRVHIGGSNEHDKNFFFKYEKSLGNAKYVAIWCVFCFGLVSATGIGAIAWSGGEYTFVSRFALSLHVLIPAIHGTYCV